MNKILAIFLIISLYFIFYQLICKKAAKKVRKQFLHIDTEENNNFYLKIQNKNIKYGIYGAIVFVITIISGNSLYKSIVCGGVTYLMFVGYQIINNKAKEKEILQDLLNVTECLRVQISAGISLSIALRGVSSLCKNKEFSSKLQDLYLEYELSKFTVGTSGRELQNRFNYSEMKIFISALNQQSRSEYAFEAFDNLIGVLREKYIYYMEENTKSKNAIMICGVCIVVFNLGAMSIYPVIIEAMEALKIMLM